MESFADFRWTSADKLTLYARDYAAAGPEDRTAIVCLHGLTRNSRDFELLAPWLAARGHRVLVPEMRGRGRSEYDFRPENYVPPIYAQDIIALLDQAGVDTAVFIGTSMGGIIATIVAALAPSKVAGAILNDVGPEVDLRGIARISSYVGQNETFVNWDDAVAYVQRINGNAFPHFGPDDWMAFARRTFRDDDGVPQLDYDPAIRKPITDPGAVPPRAAAAWAGFETLAEHRPVLILRGANSDILSRETAERMKQCGDRVSLVEIAGVGHAPTLDELESRSTIENWLDVQDWHP